MSDQRQEAIDVALQAAKEARQGAVRAAVAFLEAEADKARLRREHHLQASLRAEVVRFREHVQRLRGGNDAAGDGGCLQGLPARPARVPGNGARQRGSGLPGVRGWRAVPAHRRMAAGQELFDPRPGSAHDGWRGDGARVCGSVGLPARREAGRARRAER